MGGAVFEKGAHRIVRQVTVDREKLEKIVEILEIPEADRAQIISDTEAIHIYVAAPRPRARGRTRQRK